MSNIDVNAIVVKADQTPGQVSFHNFEELKAYMSQGLSVYKTTAYSADNMSQAESDLKELRAIKKKLTDKQKELENAYSMPIEVVKKQLGELIEMVKEPFDMLDKFIKDNKKRVKQQKIMDYAEKQVSVLGEYADKVIASKAFFNQKWLNISCAEKQWKADIDTIVRNAADSFEVINSVGGKNKGALMAFYFDKLSLEGAEQFMETMSEEVSDDVASVTDEDAVVGYKVLKVFGTERQMLQLMTQLDLSDMEFEELEDGMPKAMEEVTETDLDSFVAFDIEHTSTFGIAKGDAESEIIEIGAVRVVNGQIVEKFDMLANPGRKIVPRVTRITHITDEMVKDQPPVDDVIKQFKEFVGDSILIGHNCKSCDIPHITRAAKRAGVNFANQYLDTMTLAKKFKGKNGWGKIKLPYLAQYYGIPQADAHRAWCDAEATAYVYLKLREE